MLPPIPPYKGGRWDCGMGHIMSSSRSSLRKAQDRLLQLYVYILRLLRGENYFLIPKNRWLDPGCTSLCSKGIICGSKPASPIKSSQV
jgi:hypothetical protein